MAKVEIKLNNAGVMELFRSKEMQEVLQEVADEVARVASDMSGETYDGNTKVLSKTAIGYVTAHGHDARKDALENNTPLKAASAVGLSMTPPPVGSLTRHLQAIVEEELDK